MDCREIQAMIIPYINSALDDEQLKIFLKHIKTCKECKEELEIYYMVDVGLKQLDGAFENYNLTQALETEILMSEQRIKNQYSILIAKYVVSTLVAISVILMVFLQFRIWS